jgi:ABC-type Mn2+/Zn2+ transport system ATPase subunit
LSNNNSSKSPTYINPIERIDRKKGVFLKIFYAGKNSDKRTALIKNEQDIIILGIDLWDDFDFQTTFPTTCQMKGNRVHIGSIQILIENQLTSYKYLDKLIAGGWDGQFPIPDTNYISVPAALTFYEQIDGHIGHDISIEAAKLLKDASYMVWIDSDPKSIALTDSDGFRKSLQRERGAVAAYLNAWKLFNSKSIAIGDMNFRFRTFNGDVEELQLKFNSNDLLPHDINVLIGPNGSGKSQTLMQLVDHWLNLDPDAAEDIGFTSKPNLNQIVVVSYSPFERFPVDISHDSQDRRDHEVYKYFGMRGRRTVYNERGEPSNQIRLSQSWPRKNAAESLLACVADDQRYGAIRDWSEKVLTMERVLKTAIDFDATAVVVTHMVNPGDFLDNKKLFSFETGIPLPAFIDLNVNIHGEALNIKRHVPITADRSNALNTQLLKEHLIASEGVVFLKGGRPVELSSGQRLFSYIVINILGAIRRNSLILIDEPELFLHPTLEIAFISMLKEILTSYRSKALLATHSLVTVRELPRDCVHVYDKTEHGLFINHPPFETFGGDIQRISSYAFGDKSVSKPFETWIKSMLEKYGSAEELIKALGENINEEMIVQISAMGAGKW